MFKHVHHVQYVVRDLDEAMAYMERNFGLKPDGIGTRHGKEATFRVGQTQIQILEPNLDAEQSEFLQKHGPGIHHVSWAVENIEQMAKDLTDKGYKLRNGDKPKLLDGCYIVTFDTAGALGEHIQLSQDYMEADPTGGQAG